VISKTAFHRFDEKNKILKMSKFILLFLMLLGAQECLHLHNAAHQGPAVTTVDALPPVLSMQT
jgi:hypothetical protein